MVVTATLALPPASRILVSSAVVSFQLWAETVSPVMISTLTGPPSLGGRIRGAAASRVATDRAERDLVELDRPEDRHGHVEAVGQVAVGVEPVAVPERCVRRHRPGELQDDGVSRLADGRLEDERDVGSVLLADRETRRCAARA